MFAVYLRFFNILRLGRLMFFVKADTPEYHKVVSKTGGTSIIMILSAMVGREAV